MSENESMYDEAKVRQQLRRVPKFETVNDALAEILRIATDKRTHVLLVDCLALQELKLKIIAKVARQAKKLASDC